jgi:hypothetical protein
MAAVFPASSRSAEARQDKGVLLAFAPSGGRNASSRSTFFALRAGKIRCRLHGTVDRIHTSWIMADRQDCGTGVRKMAAEADLKPYTRIGNFLA